MSMIDNLRTERDKLRTQARQLVTNAEREKRDLSPAEKIEFDTVEQTLEQLSNRIEDLTDHETRKADLEKLSREIQPDPTPEGRRQYRVTSDESTYRDGGRHSFFADAIAVRYGVGGDPHVGERQARHAAEMNAEYRDIGTSALGALVVPQYLPEKFAAVLRAGRVTANVCSHELLPPDGMTLSLPRGTTGTVVAAQTGENFSITEVDFDETTLTVPVRTYAGFNDVSRQGIERGFQTDSLMFADLAAAYAKSLDADIINGAGTAVASHTGILNTSAVISVTTGTATGTAVLRKIADAAQQVASTRYMAPDVIIMHPRRWGWLAIQSDSNGRPLLDAEGKGFNVFGSGNLPGEGLVGTLYGLPTYVDANIPTTISTSTITGSTEDSIIIARSDDLLLYEDGPAPRTFRFDDVGSATATIRLVVLDYSAFTAGWKPSGIAVLSGSGMTTPSFS